MFRKSLIALAALALFPGSASARYDGYIGEIMTFAGNFCPMGWASTDGSLLPIANNELLFALIGTTYGGDGQSTFALPKIAEISAPSSQASARSLKVCIATEGNYPSRP